MSGFALKNARLIAENERPANKQKSTNRHRDTNYKTLDLIDLTKVSYVAFHWVIEPIPLHAKISYLYMQKYGIFTCKNIVSFACDKI